MLFVPGDRPERFDKAVASGTDLVVLDIEDAVAPEARVEARQEGRGWLRSGQPAAVRINAAGTPWYDDDLDLVRAMGAAVMLPRAPPSSASDVAGRLRSGQPLIALVETAA